MVAPQLINKYHFTWHPKAYWCTYSQKPAIRFAMSVLYLCTYGNVSRNYETVSTAVCVYVRARASEKEHY